MKTTQLQILTSILLVALIIACNPSSPTTTSAAETTEQIPSGERITKLDSAIQFLLTSSATDFKKNNEQLPVQFRNVKIGHVDLGTKKQYRMCGEYQTAENQSKNEWAGFATIITSDYEQWLGDSALTYCSDTNYVVDVRDDMSLRLMEKLDALK